MANTKRSLKDKLKDFEDSALDDIGYSSLPPKDILAFNEMRSCADLYRMIRTNQIDIQPSFQRSIVWTKKEQCRFIDSLMKSLPIPSICISLDETSGERQVIDGLQRLYTIQRFLSDDEWTLDVVSDVDERISGKSNVYLKSNEKKLYSNVENLMIPITVIRCNYQKDDHLKYIFMIFNRLNTGGKKLSYQEIRNCIFSGKFNDLLIELKQLAIDHGIYEYDASKIDRFEIEENILRFFAFEEHLNDYNGTLTSFLNDYMKLATRDPHLDIDAKRSKFIRTLEVAYRANISFTLSKLSKTVVEGILIGIAKNLEYTENASEAELRGCITSLLNTSEYDFESLSQGIAVKAKVISRLYKAIEIFGYGRV
jgi:hypothetical protein